MNIKKKTISFLLCFTLSVISGLGGFAANNDLGDINSTDVFDVILEENVYEDNTQEGNETPDPTPTMGVGQEVDKSEYEDIINIQPGDVSAAMQLNTIDLSEFNSAKTAEAFIVLSGFGIISGYPDGTIRPENAVTRTELCVMLLRLMSMDRSLSAGMVTESDFSDVSVDYWGHSYIKYAYDSDIIQGYGAGLFGPDDEVTYTQAIKMLVAAMGYQNQAEHLGGYPIGYNMVASNLGITRGLVYSNDGAATRGWLMGMLYNTLNVKFFIGDDEKAFEGVTVLENIEQVNSIKLVTGQVMAVGSSSIVGESSLKNNQIDINGIVCDSSVELNPYTHLGRRVIGFCSNKGDNDLKLTSIFLAPGKNEVLIIDKSDITEYRNWQYKYMDDSKREHTVTVNKDASVIYNGTGLTSVNANTLDIRSGSVILLDSNASGEYDVVLLTEYQSYVVTSVSEANNSIHFRDDNVLSGQPLAIEIGEIGREYYIADNRGKHLALDVSDVASLMGLARKWTEGDINKIKSGDIVSVLHDYTQNVTVLAISDNVLNGRITSINYADEEISIDGKEYRLLSYGHGKCSVAEEDLKMNYDIVFYIDVFGNVTAIDTNQPKGNSEIKETDETAQSYGYAYLIKGMQRNSLSNFTVSLLLGKTFNPRDDAHTIEEQTVITLECSRTVTVDGNRVKSEQDLPINSVIEYWTNDEGQVSKIAALDSGVKKNRRYNKEHMMFFDNTPTGAFKADENTMFFIVPNRATRVEDYEVIYPIKNNTTHDIQSFGVKYMFNTGMPVSAAAVIFTDTLAHQKGLISESTPITIVSRVIRALDENSMKVSRVYCYTDGAFEELLFRADVSGDIMNSLKTGDVVRLSRDADGKIDNYAKIASMSEITEDSVLYRAGARGNNERVLGRVYDKREGIINPVIGQIVQELDIVYTDDFSEMRTYHITESLEESFYVFERGKNNKIRLADYHDVSTYVTHLEDASQVFLCISKNIVKAIIVLS